MELIQEFDKKETKQNKEIKNGYFIIRGKNMSGKTRLLSKIIKENSLDPFVCSLNHFISLETQSKRTDIISNYFIDIPFSDILVKIKKEIKEIELKVSFSEGQKSLLDSNPKKFKQVIKLLKEFQKKSIFLKKQRLEKINKQLLLKKSDDKIKGVYFTDEYQLGTNKFLDSLFSNKDTITTEEFLYLKLNKEMLEEKWFDYSKYSILENSDSFESFDIVVLQKRLEQLVQLKKDLVSRKIQKKILNDTFSEMTCFLNNLCFLEKIKITEIGIKKNNIKVSECSGFEQVLIELGIKLFFLNKNKNYTLFIDELFDKVFDPDQIQDILKECKKFKTVYIVSHRKDISFDDFEEINF